MILPDGEKRLLTLDGCSIKEILDELEINHLEVLVAKNGRIVPEDDLAEKDDEIKVIRVVHGG
jgi:sulfur carrier protein